jgi:hypothetical protein
VGLQNSSRWHEDGEGVLAVLTDDVAAVNPSTDKVLEVKWSRVGGQDECSGELWCTGCLL